MRDGHWGPYAALGVGVGAVSWAAVLVRAADAPPLVIAAYRLGLAAIPVATLALVQQRRRPEPLTMGALWPPLLAAAFLAAHFGFWFTALQHTSIVTAVVLMATQPLFVALASPLLLRERVEPRVWLALVIAMTGTSMLAVGHLGDGLGTIAGDMYAVLGGAFAAGYLMVGRRARQEISWVRYVGVVYAATAVILLGAMLAAGDPMTGYSTKTLVMIGLLALGPQLIGHTALNWALGYVPAVLVAMAILAEPVGATALAALILGEMPSVVEALGSMVVLVGVYIALRPQHEEPPAVGEEPARADG